MVSVRGIVSYGVWALLIFLTCAEARPFLDWLIGLSSARRSRNYGSVESAKPPNYGDICRTINPSPWTADGFQNFNCP